VAAFRAKPGSGANSVARRRAAQSFCWSRPRRLGCASPSNGARSPPAPRQGFSPTPLGGEQTRAEILPDDPRADDKLLGGKGSELLLQGRGVASPPPSPQGKVLGPFLSAYCGLTVLRSPGSAVIPREVNIEDRAVSRDRDGLSSSTRRANGLTRSVEVPRIQKAGPRSPGYCHRCTTTASDRGNTEVS